MKLALLLFGMSKCEYKHWDKNTYLIDYNNSYDNYKEYIYDFFEKKGYDIDVFFVTNVLDENDKIDICNKYKPVKCDFIENDTNHTVSRNKKIDRVIDLCLSHPVKYDLVLITRFDLHFKKKFDESNIKLDKFNLVSNLERPKMICDNFYLFPYNCLRSFSRIVKNKNERIGITSILRVIRTPKQTVKTF